MRILTLVGLMGAGKSTVARRLAERWGWDPRDLDEAIVARAGSDIETIFERDGEAAFRALERAALTAELARERCVLATGGGAPAQPGAMDAMLAAGPVAWLSAAPELLAERAVRQGGRPLLAGCDADEAASVLRRQLEERGPHYGRATFTVDAGGAPDAVADGVERELKARGLTP